MTFENELAKKMYDEIINTHKVELYPFEGMHITQQEMCVYCIINLKRFAVPNCNT
ncbi:hypothetical protein SAMN02745691_02461 [Parasporobacterium paucivorans DSM 15970]|uniref:Uncharacterized protein n=1 Tax=Parasporobacterium paucivorans DSM 15970 TaxID=1122934 RepID=A0A1M6LWX7_9FIRM|nr:hypothetical protein SAMN02745691_02461 [Parasporobacterium paucivorans DSM 15970]